MSGPPDPLTGDALLRAVTDAMVALHERYHHRARVTAKTRLLGDDLLACVLGGIYTEVEQTMIELQRTKTVRDTRSSFQTATQQRFIDVVERLSGREELNFVSNSHVGPDIEIEPGGRASSTVNRMVNDPFRALSHPIRRGIVERLAAGPATVAEVTGGFGVSKPAITKHLRVLEETGVMRRTVEGRTHRLSLEPDVLSIAADWMDRQRALWGRLFDVVDEYLKEEGPR